MEDRSHICAEISYEIEEIGQVHSDICFHHGKLSDAHRKLLHECLDEFLNRYDPNVGPGMFFVGDRHAE